MPGIPSTSPAWQSLQHERRQVCNAPLVQLFDADPGRFDALSLEAEGLFADFSKQRWNARIVGLLAQVADECGLASWRGALFSGERVNLTEGRAALHTALRDREGRGLAVAGRDVLSDVRAAHARMRTVSADIREGRWRGATGERIRHVVNIGIGGSDLGPLLVCEALAEWRSPDIDACFVSNVDPAHLARTLERLDPAATVLIVTSKTFTTLETIANAEAARAWLRNALGPDADLARHLVAVTASPDRAVAFGIASENVLPFWDWVGGRYSVWSAVGLAVAIEVGWERFAAFLDGAASIDRHFRDAPTPRNLPVLLALSTVWNANFLDVPQIVLAPYSQALARFPAYVQQLSLESNGKSVTREGVPVAGHTAPSFWGEPGTNAQHAFFQWLHQGTRTVPVEFIVPVASNDDPARQRLLVANALAQAQALMLGKSEVAVRAELSASGLSPDEVAQQAPHRAFPGDRPSSTLLLPRVDPWCVGQLIALFEHRTFVEALIWGINPFDQFGVELGKRLTPPIAAALETGSVPATFDASTRGLIGRSFEMARRQPPQPRASAAN